MAARMESSGEASETGARAGKRTVLREPVGGYSEAVEEEAPAVEGENLLDFQVTRRKRRSRFNGRRPVSIASRGKSKVVLAAAALGILVISLVTARVISCVKASMSRGVTPRKTPSGAALRKLGETQSEEGGDFHAGNEAAGSPPSEYAPLNITFEEFVERYIACETEETEDADERVLVHLLERALEKAEKEKEQQSREEEEGGETTEPAALTWGRRFRDVAPVAVMPIGGARYSDGESGGLQRTLSKRWRNLRKKLSLLRKEPEEDPFRGWRPVPKEREGSRKSGRWKKSRRL